MEKYNLGKDGSKALIDLAAGAFEDLFQHYQKISQLPKIFGAKETHPSFVNNFKDALMHYKKMCEQITAVDNDFQGSIEYANNNLQVLLQFELLSEHLTRGIIDAYVIALQYGSRYYKAFYNNVKEKQESSLLHDARPFLRLLYRAEHFCKTSIDDLRNNKHQLRRVLSVEHLCLDDCFADVFEEIVKTLEAQNTEIMSRLTSALKSLSDALLKASLYDFSVYLPKQGEDPEGIRKKYKIDLKLFSELNNLNPVEIKVPFDGNTWVALPL